jgi:hypothetical protein
MLHSGAPCTLAEKNSKVRRLQIPQSISVNRSTLFVLATTGTLLLPAAVSAQAKDYPLESVEGLRFHNVNAEPAVLQGKKALRATISEETLRRIERTQVDAQGQVWIEGLAFSNGVIEAEIAGALAARLYVHANEQPTLIVKDVKSGANGHGGVALWLEPGTVAHFRNLTVKPSTR